MNHCDITKKKDIDMLEAIMDIQIFIRRRSQKAEKIEAKNTNSIEGIKTIERFRGETNIKSRA